MVEFHQSVQYSNTLTTEKLTIVIVAAVVMPYDALDKNNK